MKKNKDSRFKPTDTCYRCNKRADEKSPLLAGRGHAHTDRIAVCRMPDCRKKFKLRGDQDPKYTWYCHDCRERIAEITDGVRWLMKVAANIDMGGGGE